MKILMLSTFPPQRCGVGIYTYDLVTSLRKLGNKVVIVSNKPCDADYIVDFKSSSLAKNVDKIVEKENPDIIHIQYQAVLYSNVLNMNLIKVLKSSRLPTAVTLHEVQYDSEPNTKDWLKLKVLQYMEKKVVMNASKIIVHTPNQKKFLKEKYGVNNVECIYMGLTPKKRKKRKLGRNILLFGILNYGKGVEYLIRSMKHLPEFRLTIAGRAASARYEKRIVREAKGLTNINLKIGWVSEDNKHKYYENADIVVLPYVWAPYQSAVLHDALSYGIPVVVTKVGAIYDVVKKYGLGEVIGPKSSYDITLAVNKVYSNHSKYSAGVRKYWRDANWKENGINLIKLYNSILK